MNCRRANHFLFKNASARKRGQKNPPALVPRVSEPYQSELKL